MEQQHEPIAILGIGAMGHGMATSALRAGIPTMVWNRNQDAAQDLAQLGAIVAPTGADAARAAAIVVTMVTDADAVVSVIRDDGVLAALAPGAILVQMSTIGVAGIERVAAIVAQERPDVTLLDAPVSGSKDPAERGQLTIFASGPVGAKPRVAALFDALGQRTIWVGDVGTGTRLKLVANTWLAFAAEAVVASVAETLDTAGKAVAFTRRQPAHVSLAGGQAASDRKGRVLASVRALTRSQGCASRRGGRGRPVRGTVVPG